MTRSHVREGFRRVGVVLGAVCALMSVLLVGGANEGSSAWIWVQWLAILVPVGWWIGSATAGVCGYVVAGFFPPGPPVDRVEAAKEIALNQPPFNSPQFRLVIKVRDFVEPYALYAFWVASWLAASWAAILAERWWLGEYGETMPLEWLWGARLAALAGTLVVLVGGGAIIVHWFIPEMFIHWLSPPEPQRDQKMAAERRD